MQLFLLLNFVLLVWALVVVSIGVGFSCRFSGLSERLGYSVFGSAILIVFSHGLYSVNIGMGLIWIGIFCFSLFGLVQVYRHKIFLNFLEELLTLWVVSFLFSLPFLSQGLQFTIFQGNHWDMLTYITSALTYQQYSFDETLKNAAELLLRYPITDVSSINLHGRPGVHILFGLLSLPWKSMTVHLAYPFLGLASSIVAITLSKAIFFEQKDGSRIWPIFVLGLLGTFYFQLLVDINAWSQLMATPFIISGYILFQELRVDSRRKELVFSFSLISAALAVIYPEGFLLMLLGYLFVIFLELNRSRLNFRPWYFYFWSLLAVVVATAPNPIGTWGFLLHQTKFADQTSPNWHLYFFKIFIDPSEFSRSLLNLPGKIFGLYIPEPYDDISHISMTSANNVLNAISGIFLLFLASFLRPKKVIVARVYSALRTPEAFFGLFFIFLALSQKFWIMGKLWMMVYPIIILFSVRFFYQRFGQKFLVVFILFNIFLFGWRQYVIYRSEHGIHYRTPWPAVQDPALKSTIRIDSIFDLSEFSHCQEVLIEARNHFHQSYGILSGLAQQKPIYVIGAVKTYFGSGNVVGNLPAKKFEASCIMDLNPRASN